MGDADAIGIHLTSGAAPWLAVILAKAVENGTNQPL